MNENMSGKKDILIVGVGGQGIILASKILANAGKEAGFEVKQSEVHGMSQRGGSVSTHVRFGRQVASPLIREGEADFLLSFELLEALRWVNSVRPQGHILVNNLKINPAPVSAGLAEYPADIELILSKSGRQVRLIEGVGLAEQAGSRKAMNMVLLGALSGLLPDIGEDIWLGTIRAQVPATTRQINEQAFQLGRKSMEKNI
ncbi:MAG: indolepyruvate oxidoreductase subunit beta [bacterium]